MLKIFIENLSIKDLIITLLLIALIIIINIILFTHPKTKDYFTKEI